jgi:hypothetical protein
MKIGELIARLDRSDNNRATPDAEELFVLVGLQGVDYWGLDLEKHGFQAYYAGPWLCTDTWVGTTVIFHNNQAILFVHQSARKNSPDYAFVGGKETATRLRATLMALVPEPELNVDEVDLDEEVGDGFKVNYSSQLLDKEVIIDATGERAAVVQRFHAYKDIKRWSDVVVEVDGARREITMDEVTVPWRVA